MTALPSTLEIAVGLLALVAALLGMAYLLYRLRLRRRQLRLELDAAPGLVDDRAFNQMRIARSEAEILERTGVDVHRATEQLARAQQRYDLRDYADALSLAQSAHESLVALRTTGLSRLPSAGPRLSPASRPSVGSSAERPDPPEAADAGSSLEAPAPTPPPRLAKNRAESHFQLLLLAEEVEKAKGTSADPERLEGAQALQRQSQSAFDAREYTDALRLALKARRTLGAPVETLAPARSIGGVASAPDMTRSGAGLPPLPSAACTTCGRAVAPSDQFCRACGTPKAPRLCPQCGTRIEPHDVYCGGCGAPMGPV